MEKKVGGEKQAEGRRKGRMFGEVKNGLALFEKGVWSYGAVEGAVWFNAAWLALPEHATQERLRLTVQEAPKNLSRFGFLSYRTCLNV